MKLPELSKKYLTLDEVAERWSSLFKQDVTEARVIGHAEDGGLVLTVKNKYLSALSFRHSKLKELPELEAFFKPKDFPKDISRYKEYIKSNPRFAYKLDASQVRWLISQKELLLAGYRVPMTVDDLEVAIEDLNKFEKATMAGFKPNAIPAYLDSDNKYYARELAIAIEAHAAIFMNGEGNKHKATGERVKSWLLKKYPDESESNAFVERVTTIVLPKKQPNPVGGCFHWFLSALHPVNYPGLTLQPNHS